jgi:poly(3-hydroxyalkanoate) synthetase
VAGEALAGVPAPPSEAAPNAAVEAVAAAATERLGAFFAGLDRYRRHAFRRDPPRAALAWQRGDTRLWDYAPGGGAPALFVPSLVNRGYVLDLLPGRSLLEFAVAQGVRPFLVDWGEMAAERDFDLTGFVAERLEPALAHVAALAAAPEVPVVGYCMGGNLALALALQQPQRVRRLSLLATPWDFHAERPSQAKALADTMAPLLPRFRAAGALPVDVLQTLFVALDPLLGVRKLRRFARLAPGSAEERDFVALEDWLNDGAPLPIRVAEECIAGWYGENTPGRGVWRIAGAPIRPERYDGAAQIIVPDADRIVPPAGALALAAAMPGAELRRAASGHIGMMTGRKAETDTWRPVAEFLRRTAV